MTLIEFATQTRQVGLPTSLDFKAICLGFLKQLHAAHASVTVYGLVGSDRVNIEEMRLTLVDKVTVAPTLNHEVLLRKQTLSKFLDIKADRITEIDANDGKRRNHLGVYEPDKVPEFHGKRPYYLSNYRSWEESSGHYDPLTEIYHCGLVLASIAFGLDLSEKPSMLRFTEYRNELHKLNDSLHPSILNVIRDMTALYREDRLQTLEDAILRIEDYGTFNPDLTSDLTQSIAYKSKKEKDRKAYIMDKLKSRLYDISRKNRLIYHRPQKSFANLTVNSVPILLDYRNIDESNLFYWSDSVRSAIVAQKKIDLNKFLHLKDTPYLGNRLDRIRLDARKSVNEYGFSQLRLVVAYLHWFNFKENKEEKIQSPLLLLPVRLEKKKGVQDRFEVTPEDNVLEVNPVLAHYLKDLFDIKLPQHLDLSQHTIDDLIVDIRAQIELSGIGIEIEWKKLPQVEVIHSIAKKNFSINIRKSMRSRVGFRVSDYNYSYAESNYRPLGLEIFNKKVRYKDNQLEYLINEDIIPDTEHFAKVKERTFYSTGGTGTTNPYQWEVDTCNLTLGNFNYRKMSLVNDYERILEDRLNSPAFEDLFSEDPKILSVDETDRGLLNDFSIIQSDPTQSKAVSFASSGKNYIIQGPPGTGKSQTITNLIADYIAQEKKVLFICEKRAALDVVFHRLKQKELDELCCLVHDSQSDKKSFIMDLKDTYESFLKSELKRSVIHSKRELLIEKIEEHKTVLASYHSFLSHPIKDNSITATALLDIVTAYSGVAVDVQEWTSFPEYSDYDKHKVTIKHWLADHLNGRHGTFLKDFPLIRASEKIIEHPSAFEYVDTNCKKIIEQLDQLNELIDSSELPELLFRDVNAIQIWVEVVEKALPLANLGTLDVFDNSSATSRRFEDILLKMKTAETDYAESIKGNAHWKKKLSRQDTEMALSQWKKYASSAFRFLSPGFYKLKKLLQSSIDMSAFQVKPDLGILLERLDKEYKLQSEVEATSSLMSEIVGFENVLQKCKWIQGAEKDEAEIINMILASNAESEIITWAEHVPVFKEFFIKVSELDAFAKTYSLLELEEKVSEWQKAAMSISVHLPYLKEALLFPAALRKVILTKAWNQKDIQYASAFKSLRLHLECNAKLKSTDGHTLMHTATSIRRAYAELYDLNVQYIRSSIREDFASKIEMSERSVRGMTDADRNLRKQYREARKILENEFGKSMRYKSIRELSSGDARHMLIDLKPVWLMSPLSVSDVLALDSELFDVVIFDEASQITLEEGIPALFRSSQTIIVGDEMQMPPTNFFSTSSNSIDEEEEELEAMIGINLDADSLLNQGARKLSSVMLGWHYRSRHESLISFCNAAFYDHQLLTIPDVRFHSPDLIPMEELVIQVQGEEKTDLNAVLARSISYHHLPEAVYSNRANTGEAEYIARIVRDTIRNRPDLTIGIVAFSMQQQGEIEMALENLARADKIFDEELEREYSREEDNQMVGLFVKNLENVQGDERDIIIMSVCYGINDKGKMLMNFGPINRRGGEKRLNVIFSRAKRHMMIISSIEAHQIKNDYNEGALYFKRFLEYARHISDGNIANAQGLIQRIAAKSDSAIGDDNTAILSQLKAALTEKGFVVDDTIGQSRFKVSLAVRGTETSSYRLGIVLDDQSHYENTDVVEQYCQKPQVLSGFGWEIYHLYKKDWHLKPDQVVDDIISRLTVKQETLVPEDAPVEETLMDVSTIEDSDEQEIAEITSEAKEPEVSIASPTPKDELSFDRLEYVVGSSSKFWEIAVSETSVHVRYGRIGNKPQTNTKEAETNEKAMALAKRLKDKKLKKGYVQQ